MSESTPASGPWWESFETLRPEGKEALDRLLPHRGEMSLLTRIAVDTNPSCILGELQVPMAAFWVPGHFPVPERQNPKFEVGPIFPGVLMIESAAQLSICLWRRVEGFEATAVRTMLFRQIEKAEFRREARPGDRIYIRSTMEKSSLRLMRCVCEGVVLKGGIAEPCFECRIAGLSV